MKKFALFYLACIVVLDTGANALLFHLYSGLGTNVPTTVDRHGKSPNERNWFSRMVGLGRMDADGPFS